MTGAYRRIHRTRGQGRWFPDGAGPLARVVDGFLDAARPWAKPGEFVGAIAPHAGYAYSGAIVGQTYRALRDRAQAIETVVVLGFSHQASFSGVALLDGDAVESPLGLTALDTDAVDWLVAASPCFEPNGRPHVGEHSAENQIPFVQRAVPKARLVVALFGEHDPATIAAAAEALLQLRQRRRTVVIASTDLLHDSDHARVARTDRATLDLLRTMDAAGLARCWSPGFQVCCGIGPVQTLLRYGRACGCTQGDVLGYRNSGDDHPEDPGDWVVGYGSVAYAVGS